MTAKHNPYGRDATPRRHTQQRPRPQDPAKEAWKRMGEAQRGKTMDLLFGRGGTSGKEV